MNPLYVKEKFSVISVDVAKIKLFKNKNSKNTNINSPLEKKINHLFVLHEKRLDKIFSSGKGKPERIRKGEIMFSKDKILFKIESNISRIASENKSYLLSQLHVVQLHKNNIV